VLGFALALIPGACGEDKKAQVPTPGNEIVARIGDMEFTQAELDADLAFLKRADPSLADGYIRYYLLTQVLVPRRLIQKAVDPKVASAAREKAEDLATAVRSAGGDLDSLRRYGDALGGHESPFPLFRTNDLEVPAARAAFGLAIGEVSAAVHGSWGSYVISPTNSVPGVAGSADSRTVYTVFFPYSGESDFKSRILAEAERYRKTPLEVHSRYFRELRPLATEIRILSNN
jgi:hypothetical protein